MAYPVKKDQVQQAIDRLLSQWADKPNILGLVEAYFQSIQSVEDLWFDLLQKRSISQGEGDQLDNIGLLVGVPRNFKTDEQYRIELLKRIAISRSDGSTEVVIDLLRFITGNQNVLVFEHFPAAVLGYVPQPVTDELLEAMKEITSAGVRAGVMFDQGGDSFVAGEIISQLNTMIDHSFNTIQVNEADGGAVEEITNGSFTTDVSGWSVTGSSSPGLTHDTNKAKLTVGGVGAGAAATQTLTLLADTYYRMEVTLNQSTLTNPVYVYVYDTIGAARTQVKLLSVGLNKLAFKTPSTGVRIEIGNLASGLQTGEFITFDDVTLKKSISSDLIVAIETPLEDGDRAYLPEIVDLEFTVSDEGGEAEVTIKLGLGIYLGTYLGT